MHLRRIVLLVALVAWPAVASAGESAVEQSKRHFEEGTKHFQLGEFDRAVESYKAGFKAKPDPIFLYNIAQAYRLKNDFQNALFFYRSYLSAAPDSPNRAAVQERVRKLEVEVERQRQMATMPPTEAVAPGRQPHDRPAPTPAATNEPAVAGAVAQQAPPARKPVYKQWWLWTVVGVAVVGIAVGAGVGATAAQSPSPPSSGLGTISF